MSDTPTPFDPVNQHTEAAYQIYSRNYAVFALLAYWIVWRGRIFKHIAFFRGILNYGNRVVDIAIGEGSLTENALFKAPRKQRPAEVVGIDLSAFMLEKAEKRFRGKPVKLIRGDVMELPLADGSVPVMSCFGGLNSFPSIDGALAEMKRVLAPGGMLRGSILLMPQAPWRQKLVKEWIGKGYQTISPTFEAFQQFLARSGLKTTELKRYGDVVLFELKKG